MAACVLKSEVWSGILLAMARRSDSGDDFSDPLEYLFNLLDLGWRQQGHRKPGPESLKSATRGVRE